MSMFSPVYLQYLSCATIAGEHHQCEVNIWLGISCPLKVKYEMLSLMTEQIQELLSEAGQDQETNVA